MTTETLSIRITEQGARQVSRRINTLGLNASGAAGAVKGLNLALFGVAAGVVVRGIVRISDTYTQLQNRLRTVTKDQNALNNATEDLFAISRRTRSGIEATVEVFARLQRGTRDLGVSRERLLKVTENLNKATILSGATSKEAENALIQLSQGISSGALRGDELRSVLEQLPFVADLIARQLGVTRGELRKLGKEGVITSEQVVLALENVGDQLDDFDKTIPTLGQSFAVLRNSAIKFFGELGTRIGGLQALNRAILLLADNFALAGRAVISLATVLAGVLVRRGILLVIAKLRVLTAVALANPFLALIAAVTAATTFFVQFARDLGISNKVAATAKFVFDELKATVLSVANAVGSVLTDALGALKLILNDVFKVTLSEALDFLVEFGDATIKLFKLILTVAVRIFTALPRIIAEAFRNARTVVDQARKGGEITDGNAEFAKQRIADQQRDIKFLNEQIQTSLATGNNETADKLREQRDILKEGNRQLRKAVEGAARARLQSGAAAEDALSSNALDDTVKQIEADADRITRASGIIAGAREVFRRTPRDEPTVRRDDPENLTRNIPPTDDALKAAQKFRDEFAKLEGSLDPILAATIKYQESLGLLNKALRQGIIDQKRYDELVKELGRSLTTALNPLEQWIQKQEEQIELFQLDGQERSLRIEQRRVELELQNQGIRVTELESQMIRENIEARREAQRLFEEREASIRRAQGLLQQTSELGINPIVDSLEQLQNAGTSIDLVFQKNIVNAFGMAENALVQFVTTGQLKFREFATAVVADLTRLLARLLLIQSLQFLIGGNPSGASITGGALQSLQGFQRGGSFTVGGTGAPDTELVAFRATKGEKVTIETAAQQVDSRQNAEASAQAADVNLTSVNVLDPNLLLDVIESPQGEKRVLNVIRRNPDLLRALR